MDILTAFLSPLFIFAFVLAWLFLLKEGFLFYRSLRIGKMDMNGKRLWGIGVSVSYIITALACGFLTL